MKLPKLRETSPLALKSTVENTGLGDKGFRPQGGADTRSPAGWRPVWLHEGGVAWLPALRRPRAPPHCAYVARRRSLHAACGFSVQASVKKPYSYRLSRQRLGKKTTNPKCVFFTPRKEPILKK